MQAIDSCSTGVPKRRGPGWPWEAPTQATAAVLELAGSEYPELLEFQVHALLNSTMGFALRKFAAALGVPPEKIGGVIGRACADLNQLEKLRKVHWEPNQILGKPNLAALLSVCQARLDRVSRPPRRLRLEKILRRLKPAYELAQTRTWIDDFIGPLPAKPREAQGADR